MGEKDSARSRATVIVLLTAIAGTTSGTMYAAFKSKPDLERRIEALERSMDACRELAKVAVNEVKKGGY